MVESYMYLNKGQFLLLDEGCDGKAGSFEVRVPDYPSQVFQSEEAKQWVSILSQLSRGA